MDRAYWENKNISVYWWNMGKKTMDYRGTYKGFLEAKDIKVSNIRNGKVDGYEFQMSLSSTRATIIIYSTDFGRACNDAIKTFLALMGDKARLDSPIGSYLING